MKEYADKKALIDEIKLTASLFIKEFVDVAEAHKDVHYYAVDRTPKEIISYQLGWMGLIRGWDRDELNGIKVVTPAPGYKWNQMVSLYQSFYDKYKDKSLSELQELFIDAVASFTEWLNGFSDDELFKPGGRNWAASTSSNWPVWKWVHMNTVAPFTSFRSKIRKWKRLHSEKYNQRPSQV
jgi:hypothetical protein